MSDSPRKNDGDEGSPAWIMTFADLMSLLLTFFILLLSFAELNATKFRKVSGSLKMAFGVQRQFVFDDPPAGSSFLMQEHRQGGTSSPLSSQADNVALLDPQLQAIKNKQKKDSLVQQRSKVKKLERNFNKLYKRLEKEIKAGRIEVSHRDNDLVIRIAEEFTFPKNRASIKKSFDPFLQDFSELLAEIEGEIHVAGHTDDRKVASVHYKSNWELSAARAMVFSQALMKQGDISEERFVIQAHGATRPVVQNNSEVNRKKNRRIEITIRNL